MSPAHKGLQMLSRGLLRSACSAFGPAAASQLPAVTQLASSLAATNSAWISPFAPSSSSRTLWTSSPVLSAELAKTLSEEVKYENDNYQKPDAIKAGPPAPWTVVDEPGDTLVTLKRKYKGEDVEVNLQVNSQPSQEMDDEGEEGEEPLNTVVFNVHVVKGDYALVVECESDGTAVSLMHISYEPAAGYESESSYTGPVFDELDEGLQHKFQDYLEERGITAELGEYLRHLIYDKEQREYVRWLSSVSKFVQ